jgi:Zn-dependent M28 family amino/carboxypeptidase
VFNRIARPRGAGDPPREASPEQAAQIRLALDCVRRLRAPRPDAINHGGDDDGSGSVLLVVVADALARLPAARRPRRSVLFVWHTAEEKGLYGSQYHAEHPTVPRDSIVAMINMDRMGRGYPSDNPPAGPHALEVIGPRRRSTRLGDIAERVHRAGHHDFKLSYAFDQPGEPTQAWCRSDHFEYARFGVPVIFFVAAAWYLDYHMVSDEPQYVDFDRLAGIGRYISEVTRALADLNQRPTVDQPAPDPEAICRQ